MSKTSNEFVLHLNLYEKDYHYESQRKNEFISIIAESYYKLIKKKLKFAYIDQDNLRQFVTTKGQKYFDTSYTLMDQDYYYIDDIIKKNIERETKGKDNDEKDKKDNKNDVEDDKNKNKTKKKLGEIIMNEEEKENYDINLYTDQNPFKKVLIRGVTAYGVGNTAMIGSLATCIMLDTVSVTSALTFYGGAVLSVVGFYVTLPSLLGFGIYKLYQMNKDKRRKEFFDCFKLDKMKVEREVQIYVVDKIDKYFSRYISEKDDDINQLIEECKKNINSILDIYINKDDQILNGLLIKPNKKLIQKLNNDSSIILLNIIKIRTELLNKILSLDEQNVNNIFKEGISLFKEFIKNFGPQRIDPIFEKQIDDIYIKRIIFTMEKLLNNNMQTPFKKFDSKHFEKSFELYLCKKYEEKKKLDDITESNFISDCNKFLINPVSGMYKNYGVLSLYFKFTIIIEEIGIKRKEINYNKSIQKILKLLNKNNVLKKNDETENYNPPKPVMDLSSQTKSGNEEIKTKHDAKFYKPTSNV